MIFVLDLHAIQFCTVISIYLVNLYMLFEALYLTKSSCWLYVLVVITQAYSLSLLIQYGDQIAHHEE